MKKKSIVINSNTIEFVKIVKIPYPNTR